MWIKRCDRCGKLYESNELFDARKLKGCDDRSVIMAGLQTVDCNEDARTLIDLCDECISAFIIWYKGGESE